MIVLGIYRACPDYWPGLEIFSVGVGYSASLGDSQIIDPSLPPAVVAFIGKFDAGDYPDLAASRITTTTTVVAS